MYDFVPLNWFMKKQVVPHGVDCSVLFITSFSNLLKTLPSFETSRMEFSCPRQEYFGKLLPKFNHSWSNIPKEVSFSNINPYFTSCCFLFGGVLFWFVCWVVFFFCLFVVCFKHAFGAGAWSSAEWSFCCSRRCLWLASKICSNLSPV